LDHRNTKKTLGFDSIACTMHMIANKGKLAGIVI
jgi:hypothetical protein